MKNSSNIKEKRALEHEKLIKQYQNSLAKLIDSLDDSQYKLLTKYIRCTDKLRRHEFIDIMINFKDNKKG